MVWKGNTKEIYDRVEDSKNPPPYQSHKQNLSPKGGLHVHSLYSFLKPQATTKLSSFPPLADPIPIPPHPTTPSLPPPPPPPPGPFQENPNAMHWRVRSPGWRERRGKKNISRAIHNRAEEFFLFIIIFFRIPRPPCFFGGGGAPFENRKKKKTAGGNRSWFGAPLPR